MTFPKPENVTMQGGPISENETQEYFTSPTAYFSADMKKGSGETLKRRMQIDYSLSPTGPWLTEVDYGDGYKTASSEFRGNVVVGFQTGDLQPDTVYYFRLYAQRSNGTVGSPYFTGSILTPETPDAPTLATPTNESDISIAETSITFTWDYVDQGHQDTGGSYFFWRTAPVVGQPAGDWHTYVSSPTIGGSGDTAWGWWPELPCFPPDAMWPGLENTVQRGPQHTTCPDPTTRIAYATSPQGIILDPEVFPLNQRIEWKTANLNDVWDGNGPISRGTGDPNVIVIENRLYLHPGPDSPSKFFTIIGPTSAPRLIDPTGNEGIVVSDDQVFEWKFRDPVFGTTQKNAYLRYREVGEADWVYIDLGTAYTAMTYTVPANTFSAATHYEWQAQTTNDRGEISDWSTSELFWGIPEPGSGLFDPTVGEPLGALGCGTHRVFIYDRGGIVRRGEITQLARVIWERRRDDISEASFIVNNWDDDCGELLANIHTWQHELVIFRTNEQNVMERVWEGPISRITYKTDEVEVHARDVMNYVYRRVMRQGYDDHYRIVGGEQVGLKTVIYRASRIITNALAYDDPNIIQYMTLFEFDDDAKESRVVDAYSKTAWEEVDDLAATAGLDYTTVGRRIILWDTHRPIGLLPEMRDGDFSDDPIVSEYGMSLANYFAVTNNAGVYGDADRLLPDGTPEFYGFIEQLASAYGEAEGAAEEVTLTPAALAALQQTLADQAERNIGGRYPAPVIVRVPDNTTLNPDVAVGINQLIPGVHVPVRSVGTLRDVAQMQKLDYVRMTEEKGLEIISITLSPAPAEVVVA